MSAQKVEKPNLRVSAKHIGPIMELEAELSSRSQHLIFARNGTGKSFIARALRLLDPAANESETEEEIPSILVSEEATNHQGTFGLFEGAQCIGSIGLNAKVGTVNRSTPSYIYHVFSEDFIEAHVRNRLHGLDGNITHEIVVGKENTEIDAKNKKLSEKRKEVHEKLKTLDKSFDLGKEKLKSDFNITGSLGAFKQLSSDTYFTEKEYLEPKYIKNIATLLNQYNIYKSLPTDPSLPKEVDAIGLLPDYLEIEKALKRITSPSSVAAQFKEQIRRYPLFFELGLKLLGSDKSNCPFCTQDLTHAATQAIDAYTKFFNDEEAVQIRLLNRLQGELQQQINSSNQKRLATLEAKVNFEDLKKYFPSMSDTSPHDLSVTLDKFKELLEQLQNLIASKIRNLAAHVDFPIINSVELKKNLSEAIGSNSKIYESIVALVTNSRTERLSIQTASCVAFSSEFSIKIDVEIREIRRLHAEIIQLVSEIEVLQKKHGDGASAKGRVVKTFQLLLRYFFPDAYTFDEKTFSVRRRNNEITRGPDRTLSDGEKSIIAFCYYIARIHLRVESIQDYKKLFFIIDDPVSSLSFDYIYGIAQCLKYLRISNDGEVLMSLEPQLTRPKMIILTHNNYFYNVISSNNVVRGEGLYQLVAGVPKHELSNQKAFATPHVLQLRDVYEVSKGKKSPDHTTPNSIRSVIEGMWKFCRPDIQEFEAFVKLLISDHQIEIKSVLLNDLCHGGKFYDHPHQEAEIVEAATEALRVVETFARGQLKLCE